MNAENQLVQAITGKPNLAGTSKEDWQQLLHQYPAFGIAQYLYAKKLTLDADPAAEVQRQLAAIHFNDLRWLDNLLSKSGEQLEARQHPISHPASEPLEGTAVTTPSIVTVEETPPTASAEKQKQASALALDKEAEKPVEVPEPEPEVGTDELDVPPSEQYTDTITQKDNSTIQEGPGYGLDNQRLSSLVSAQLADFKKPVTDDVPIGFKKEPLYKTDYFASQGIILGKSQDELGKKVKKFTDWLKEMKQPGLATPQLQTTKQEELQIIQKAAISLQPEAVLTESMAEVLLQQGKRVQAIDVYQKLSLLYPEKTSYFASKIDSLQQ